MKKFFTILALVCGFVGCANAAIEGMENHKKCNKVCASNSEYNGKYMFCEDVIWMCANDIWQDIDTRDLIVRHPCDYKSPVEQGADANTFLFNDTAKQQRIYSKKKLSSGDIIDINNLDMCWGCADDLIFVTRHFNDETRRWQDAFCVDRKSEDVAWCAWRKDKEKMNIFYSIHGCECLDANMEWSAQKHTCVETTVTADVAKKWKDAYICGEGECGYYGETKDIFGGCTATNKDCTGKPDNSKTSECKYVAKTNDKNAEKFYTCHATSCNDGYWEWFVKKDNQYVGKGICHSKTVVERCMNECNNCRDGQTCKPVYVKDEKQRENRGYAGCSCQPIDSAENNQEKPKEEIKEEIKNETGIGDLKDEEIKKNDSDNVCYFIYKFEINCNGEVIPGEGKIDITALVSDENCSVDGDKLKQVYNDKKDEIIANIKKIIDEKCPTAAANTGAGKTELDSNTKAAIAKLDALFGGKRTVWRTEEGKFNTARLASDATAGVVLGTVGGIVSGKVIKKKQLEKGFDALQCTVGGQKMADYGDTFQVTFRR